MIQSEPILEIKDLKKYFPLANGKTVKAVDGVSMKMYKGETLGWSENPDAEKYGFSGADGKKQGLSGKRAPGRRGASEVSEESLMKSVTRVLITVICLKERWKKICGWASRTQTGRK